MDEWRAFRRREVICRGWTYDGYVDNLLHLKLPVVCGEFVADHWLGRLVIDRGRTFPAGDM